MPLISVIIANANKKELTLRCLRFLYDDLRDIPAEVWVVDDASSDGSARAIEKEFPQVRMIENNHNLGYGASNNQAMERAEGEFFLVLNNDAFLKQGATATMIQYMNEHPEVGVVGPHLVHADGRLQKSCWHFPSPLRAWFEALGLSAVFPNHHIFGDYYRWRHDKERLVEFVIGACMLVRRKVYEEAGGFDENIFMYYEEIDWQRRIRSKGWEVAFVPSAQAVHLGGATIPLESVERREISLRSADYYELKHHGLSGLIVFRLATIVGCFLRIISWPLLMAAKKKSIGYLKLQLYLFIRQSTYWKIGPTKKE